jgi:NAD+ kinase
MPPKIVGLIAHTGKPGAGELVGAVADEFAKYAIATVVEEASARLAQRKTGGSTREVAAAADLLVVLGGDGTILNVTGQLGREIKPIFGINIGSLGFLTCSSSNDYREAVAAIAEGKITFSERAVLDVRIIIGGRVTTALTALNDAVFSRGELSRLIRLRTRVNSEILTDFNADGLIVATATGSTAYSLSAGGPIVDPESGALVITPICPHVLTNRSIIVPDDSVIEIEAIEKDYPVFLTVDGRDPIRLEANATVSTRKAEMTLPLAVMPGVSFFSVVRQKLKWSGSNV